MIIGLRMPHRPLQRVMREHHRPAGPRLRDLDQDPAYVAASQLQRDRTRRPAVQPFAQPVLNRIADGLPRARLDTDVDVRVQRLQLVLDIQPGVPGHLAAYPLPVPCEPERHLAAPASRASPVTAHIAPVSSVIKVARIFTKPALRHARERNTWLPTWLPRDLGSGLPGL